MKHIVAFLLCAGWLFAVSVAGGQDTKDDSEKLQGVWKVMSAERNGKKQPDDELKGLRLTFKADKIVFKDNDKEQEATYKLDPDKKPKAIDLVVKVGDKTETIPGIYQLNGDDLKICAAGEPGKPRPTEFATRPATGTGLILLKREKP
ncbi:MAG: TIGR03067 domain-containing protein [Gemmataceae bacterium]|nr:TIGR03067 domain-containing protein [Gemmataceae bacterium]